MIYEYECSLCRADAFPHAPAYRHTIQKPLKDLESPERCPRCGTLMELVPSRPASFPVGKYGKGNR